MRLILMAVVTPLASVVVDHFPRKAAMVAADLVRGRLVLAAPLMIWVDAPVVVVFVLAAVTGDSGVAGRADDLIARRIPTY